MPLDFPRRTARSVVLHWKKQESFYVIFQYIFSGVNILPLIHKCFPYQPFKNQVILPQFSSKLPLNNQPHTIVLSLCLNVFIVFTLQNILLTWFHGLGVCSGKNLWSLAYFSWVSPGSVCHSPTFEGKINSNSSLASNFQEFFPYQSRGKWKFIYPCNTRGESRDRDGDEGVAGRNGRE